MKKPFSTFDTQIHPEENPFNDRDFCQGYEEWQDTSHPDADNEVKERKIEERKEYES